MTEIVDAQVVESTELVPAPPSSTLLRTDDPVEVIAKATEVANALKTVLVNQRMIQSIQGKDHVKVEGWVTLGAMLGVVPVVVWTRKLDRGWEARVEARTMDGRVVGAAEAECLRDERRWKDADDYAIRSMAQTRATSKALGGPLRFIVTLAGFEGTPLEEIPEGGFNRGNTHSGGVPSEAQKNFIKKLVQEKKPTAAQLTEILRRIGLEGVDCSVPGWTEKLSAGKQGTASLLITWLKENPLPSIEHPSDLSSDFDVPEPTDGDPF